MNAILLSSSLSKRLAWPMIHHLLGYGSPICPRLVCLGMVLSVEQMRKYMRSKNGFENSDMQTPNGATRSRFSPLPLACCVGHMMPEMHHSWLVHKSVLMAFLFLWNRCMLRLPSVCWHSICL